MTALFYYLLKVMICSGILFTFYYFFLRNKTFHQYNRFFLLSAILVSLVIPSVEFRILKAGSSEEPAAVQLIQVMEQADYYMEEVTVGSRNAGNPIQWTNMAYAAICLGLSIILIRSLFNIMFLIRRNKVHLLDKIKIVDTSAPGTPFSFFRYIFWNRGISLESDTGKQILQHEMVHVRENHSIDKLFMQLVLVACWINPFFWLIRNELRMIHEFIADQKSVALHGTDSFAAMVLGSVFPMHYHSLSSHFFQTSIKRRIAMLTKTQKSKINYLSRIAALVLVTATVLAFTVRSSEIHAPAKLENGLVVVIDPGHGVMENGQYNGAASEGFNEDDIVLSIAKKVQELNRNKNIRILLTRDKEVVKLADRIRMAEDNGASLFISLHTNEHPSSVDSNGIEIYVSPEKNIYEAESILLGSILQQEMSKTYDVKPQLLSRKNAYILKNNVCPAVIIECGYITNAEDRKFISSETSQEQLALNILESIEQYAKAIESESGKTGTRIGYNKKATGSQVKQIKDQHNNTDLPPVEVQGVPLRNDTIPSVPVESKVDVEAAVQTKQWRAFLSENLQEVIIEASKNGAPAATYTLYVKFIVELDGRISNISVLNDPGYGFGEKVKEIMKRSPRWQPGILNNKKVRSYHTQPINLIIADAPGADMPAIKL